MGGRPAATLQVSATQTQTGARLVGGPLRLMGWSFTDGAGTESTVADTSVAAPVAGAVIASLALGNGEYTIQWWFELTGTPGAADVDNVQIQVNLIQVDQSVNPGAVGNYGPFTTQVTVTGGPLALQAKAIGAATAGTTYRVKMVATPINPSQATIFDGSGSLLFSSIQPGGVDNEWFGDSGIAVDTELRVQATNGVIQGTVFYYYSPEHRDEAEQLPVQEN